MELCTGIAVFPLIKGNGPCVPLYPIPFTGSGSKHFCKRARSPYRSGDIKGLYLNFRFDGTRLLCTTGTSFHTFVLDKSLEHLWDGTVMKLFASKGLEFEENG
ncbi:MAG: DUF5721 family protein [Sellimonas intestinalis]